ncbi:MAG: S-layer homology domain-containing protein [Fervidobacterium sp.]
MKKLLVILSVILFAFVSMAAFRDVPRGHWAESYVSRLEQIGIITGFPDGTFRGDEAVTRYQSALLISRTLDYVELSLKDKQAQIDSLLQIIKRLQNTLEASSNDFSKRIDEIETEIQNIKLTLELHDQDIIKLFDITTQLQDKFVYTDEEGNTSEIDLSALKNDIAGLSEILSGLAAQLGDVDYLLRKQIADLDKKTSAKSDELSKAILELSARVDELKSQLEMLQSKIEDTNETVANIYNTLSDAILSLREDLTLLEETLAARIDELETRILNIESTMNTGLPALRTLIYGLSEELANAEEAMKAYTDVIAEELKVLINEHEISNSEAFEDVYKTIEQKIAVLSEAIMGQQEEITQLSLRLDEVETRLLNIESTLSTGLPAIRSLVYGLSEELANAEESMKAYTDVVAEKFETLMSKMEESCKASITELKIIISEHEQSNKEMFEDIYKTIDQKTAMLSEVVMGQQEEINQLREKLDKLDNFVVNFQNEVSEKLENLSMRLGLLEDQVASLTQVVEEVKADKSDVEEINKKLSEVEKSSATKKELEQAQTIATWGVVTGISGLIIGIIALGKVFGWF